jgi:hypothetical protein
LEIENVVSIPVKQPKLFQVLIITLFIPMKLLSFPWSTRARGLSLSLISARFICEEVLKFCPLAEKWWSLEGSGRGGLRKLCQSQGACASRVESVINFDYKYEVVAQASF